ncbi:MAG TPA: hypothetical protein VK249_15325, partial [Anaerolineales bacterium]|nr:hypothetical protein [Anaerolineales bacterium]
LERFARVKWLHRILDWLNPRRHEWNFIIAIAIGMGGLLMLVEAINEGLSQNVSVILLVLGVFLGIEAAAILLGYYLLGGFLGIVRKDEKDKP